MADGRALSRTNMVELYGPEAGTRLHQLLNGLFTHVHVQERIVTWEEVINLTTLSKRTIKRKMKDGTFPAQVRLTGSRLGWRLSDVERWMSTRPVRGDEDL